MVQSVHRVRRGVVFAIAVATVGVAALVAPAHGGAKTGPLDRAAATCEHLGGTFTTPGTPQVIFACSFPPSINVAQLLVTGSGKTIDKRCVDAGGISVLPDLTTNTALCMEGPT